MGVSRGPPLSKTPQVERYRAASSTNSASSASIGQSHPSSDTCWIFCWTCDFQAGFPNNCFLLFFLPPLFICLCVLAETFSSSTGVRLFFQTFTSSEGAKLLDGCSNKNVNLCFCVFTRSTLTRPVDFPGDWGPLGIHVVPYCSSLSGR